MAGYHTMMVGKWQDPDMPTELGFNLFFGPMCSGKASYFDELEPNPFFSMRIGWRYMMNFTLQMTLQIMPLSF